MKAYAFLLFIALFGYSSISYADNAQIFYISDHNDFDLANVDNSKTEASVSLVCTNCQKDKKSADSLVEILNSPRFIHLANKKAKLARDRTYVDANGEMRIMGMTQQDALHASRDDIEINTCSIYHEQGDLANRWCHSLASQIAAHELESRGASPLVASLLSGLLFLPKEYLVDQNPSAHDITLTYRDSLGTESSTFEVTVFGDAIADNHVSKVKPFSGSTPFLTWTRRW